MQHLSDDNIIPVINPVLVLKDSLPQDMKSTEDETKNLKLIVIQKCHIKKKLTICMTHKQAKSKKIPPQSPKIPAHNSPSNLLY